MMLRRRDWFRSSALGAIGLSMSRVHGPAASASEPAREASAFRITGLRVTPIALPDPPLLHAGGCHGPYFLRNVVELTTDEGIVGLGESPGGKGQTTALEKAGELVIGKSAFGYRGIARELMALGAGCYAGVEMACLDACGKATNRRVCELLGGPVRDPVEFAAYLFYRYAADNPIVLADPHLVDKRGKGDRALDTWGKVRTPEAMAAEADGFKKLGVPRLQAQRGRPFARSRARYACRDVVDPRSRRALADRSQRPLEGRHGDSDRQETQRLVDGILRRPRERSNRDGRGPARRP